MATESVSLHRQKQAFTRLAPIDAVLRVIDATSDGGAGPWRSPAS
jgi:hypothetical protein